MEIEQKFLVPPSFTIPQDWKYIHKSSQLNHYFDTHPVSVRTRFDSETGFEIINKWTDDGKSAHNGTQRHELTLKIDESYFKHCQSWFEAGLKSASEYLESNVDKSLLNVGVSYLSKWSRIRTTYETENFVIADEINSGYGRIIEIESKDPSITNLSHVVKYGKKLGLKVLDDNLLEKMFKFYNEHWCEYYMTDKVIFDDQRFTH